MSKTYKQIDDKLATWIKQQRISFVAMAPLTSEARLTGEAFAPRPGLTLQDYIKRCEEEALSWPPKSS